MTGRTGRLRALTAKVLKEDGKPMTHILQTHYSMLAGRRGMLLKAGAGPCRSQYIRKVIYATRVTISQNQRN